MRGEIRRLNSEGLSCRQVAQRLGLSRQTVSRWGRRLGLVWSGLEQSKAGCERNHMSARVRAADAADLAVDACVAQIRRLSEPYTEIQFSPVKGAFFEYAHPLPPSRPSAEIARSAREMYSILDRHLTREADREELQHSRGLLAEFSEMVSRAADELGGGSGESVPQVITGALLPLSADE
ncbi:MAG TPA: helix-turn-helix domain-containing protein [Streptosporangiaceae bacterium]|nr:helix-turn-helix domain-containing protein [Streptosporangiaceae bacterium]